MQNLVLNSPHYGNQTSCNEEHASATSWNPGVFIDIDGVALQGGKPFEFSRDAIKALWDNKIPFAFVTNGTYSSEVLVGELREIFDLPLTPNHIVVAPSPCASLNEFHDKRVLVCCQDESIPLIEELGFQDYITIEQFSAIFPDLDYVDHQRRKDLMKMPITAELLKAQQDFRPIEVILLLGEPVKWERSLQLLIDVLMTNGDPRQKFKYIRDPHVPIIACNKDLTFKGAAALPRFGHGAFLECLQALYMKITKNELVYEEMMGKPFLITYQYATSQLLKQFPNMKPINKFYIIGDNPDVDIKGANMFHESLKEGESAILSSSASSSTQMNKSIKNRRASHRPSISIEPYLWNPNVSSQMVESILVCTGVYNPQNDLLYHLRRLIQRQASSQAGSNLNMSSMSIKSPLPVNDSNNNVCLANEKGSKQSASETAINEISNDDDSANNEESQLTIRPNRSFSSYPTLTVNESDELNSIELSDAMSRRNSFISYFDDHQNVPDHTFDNLKVAVDYILESLGLKGH